MNPVNHRENTLYQVGSQERELGDYYLKAKETFGFGKTALIETTANVNKIKKTHPDIHEKFDAVILVDNWKPETVLKAVEPYQPKAGDAFVTYGYDTHLPATYALSERYSDTYPIKNGGDFRPLTKDQQRALLSAAQLDHEQPKWEKIDNINSDDSLDEALKHVGLPAILKAVNGSNSDGVYLINSEEEYKNSIRQARSMVEQEGYGLERISSAYLLEQYVSQETGKEHCVQGTVRNGEVSIQGIAEKMNIIDPNDPKGTFHTAGHLSIAATDPRYIGLSNSVPSWLSALGYKNGPFNIDCIVTQEGKNQFLELNPRLACSTPLFRLDCGYSSTEAALASTLGEPIPSMNKVHGYLLLKKSEVPLAESLKQDPVFGKASIDIISNLIRSPKEDSYMLVTSDDSETIKKIIKKVTDTRTAKHDLDISAQKHSNTLWENRDKRPAKFCYPLNEGIGKLYQYHDENTKKDYYLHEREDDSHLSPTCIPLEKLHNILPANFKDGDRVKLILGASKNFTRVIPVPQKTSASAEKDVQR